MQDFISDVYHRRLIDTYTEVRETFKKLGMMLSVLDRQISNIYHEIECTSEEDLDAIACTLRLKAALTRRRCVKDEMARLKPFNSMAKQALNEIEVRYEGALRASFEIRQQVNISMTVEEVAAEMGVEGLR
ncbi:hypothetical protein [Rossellomorea aquimaris]|uniref:hypothetical protein n=1 Tax=Rossellomorea aquimaris TaxID=189382 RepID=UPI0011E97DA5|nr:hypothetical protein [Rossellomorea aquimaris]TYS88976.1 hypothetical protein FZC88_12995 [Rossellomorea aquimaris]